MSKYKVSVAVPVYNNEKYVRVCVESIINQTLDDIEIILLENGCTDNCPEILDEYGKRYPGKVKVIHKGNDGYGQSINVGLHSAQGEYFAIVESDDFIRPTMLETLYYIAKKNNVDIVKGNYSIFTTNNGVIKSKDCKLCSDNNLYGKILTSKECYQQVVQKIALYTWSGIYRTEFLRKNDIYHNETPGASYQDNGFWFLTFACAETFYFVDDYFYMLRRDNPNSSIFSKDKVYCIRDEYDFILKFLERRKELYSKSIELYWWARFGAYRFNYNRIDNKYKYKFLEHFRECILYAIHRNEVNQTLYSKTLWDFIMRITNDIDRFYLDSIEKRDISIFRKIILCYQDNGLIYTIKKCIEKLSNK